MDLKQEIPHPTPINRILLGSNLAPQLAEFASSFKNPLVVCDTNTKDFVNLPYPQKVFDGTQKATLESAQELSSVNTDLFIAVGSGTINDITKYASFLAGKPYVIFGTAASMNGYASGGASLITNGHKKSFIAHTPTEIYLDTDVISSAPKHLRVAGFADALSTITCKADLALAHQITGSDKLESLTSLASRHLDAMAISLEALLKTLVFGGIAMNVAGTSAPQSQGEHMLAHYMEMQQQTTATHGLQIAVTMLAMARRIEAAGSEVTIANFDEAEILQHFGNADFAKESAAKYAGLAGKKFKITTPKINAAEIENILKSIGAPTTPTEIGWSDELLADALKYARYTRNRFTYLDVV
jgi:glycerol-1-phosphate dehydrogenase [NAD(P)+]